MVPPLVCCRIKSILRADITVNARNAWRNTGPYLLDSVSDPCRALVWPWGESVGGLITELKRRNVFRVGVFYAIASWLIMQIVDVVLPALKLPEWTITLVLVLLAIGLPLALIFA